MPTANQYTQTSEGSDENERVVDEDAGGNEIDSLNVSSDWVNRIDYIPHIIGSKYLSVKYPTSQWIPGVPEYEPSCPTYLGATERDHWGRTDHRPMYKRVSGASGWRGVPRSSWYHFSIEHCSHHNNNELEHKCLDEVVWLLNANPIHQSPEDHVPGHKY